jgi:uncharacterized protein (TIGR01244 family)
MSEQTTCAEHEQSRRGDESAMIEYELADGVVLAGQPQPEDWQRLRERGFSDVINLRSDPERAAEQSRAAESAGLRYLHLPLPAYLLEAPALEQFQQIMSQPRAGKLLLHCRTATRVALLWMLRRIVFDGWTEEQAVAELRAAGYDDDAIETFEFCSEDYFERAAPSTVEG